MTLDGLNLAVGIVGQLAHLETAQPRLTARRYTVVVEEIPLALILENGMVGSPTDNRSEDDALVGEWTIRIVTYGIAQEVTVTGRIAEIVFAVVLVHPRGLEETVWVVGLERITLFIDNQDRTWSLGEVHTVLGEAYATAG